jgi:multidrug efflux pump subunit AcrB
VVESIAQQIDPLSHLVSVMVKPATKADFLLEQHSKLTLRLHRFYARLMKQVLPRPWLVLGAFVLLVYG